ncbi:hypothetical protein [Rhodovulum sulfidophilum]|uniref:hypothetical protein n=1 Tax=Rhodovulum sulfidophilum TaxID=35806 RepID=UPI001C4CD634|nr:hypothetical protein [Rhodovulum sulfidophilum]
MNALLNCLGIYTGFCLALAGVIKFFASESSNAQVINFGIIATIFAHAVAGIWSYVRKNPERQTAKYFRKKIPLAAICSTPVFLVIALM